MQLKNGKFIEDYFNFDVKKYWDPEVVAHSLAIQNRFTGHSKHPYSVAQHTLLAARLASKDKQSADVVLGCFIHEGGENFGGDVNSCIKHLPELNGYKERDMEIQGEIYLLHNINPTLELLKTIKYYDRVCLSTEAYWLMEYKEDCWKGLIEKYPPRLDVIIQEENWREVKLQWLQTYQFLTQSLVS